MTIRVDTHLNCSNCYYRNLCPNSILPVAANNCTRYKIDPEYIKGGEMIVQKDRGLSENLKEAIIKKCEKDLDHTEMIFNYFEETLNDKDQKAKSDDGKPKLSVVPMKIIFAIEKIRKYGNNKYPEGGSDNWKTVEPERHYEASLRHTAKHWNDPFAIDPESGLPHYFHKVCDDAFFIEQNWDKFMEAIEKYKENEE